MEYLLGLIGLLLGGIGYLFVKKQSAESLLQNTETKEKLLDEDRAKSSNDAKMLLEDMRREFEKEKAEDLKKNGVKPGDFN